MEVIWHNLDEKQPENNKKYLIAWNNWRTMQFKNRKPVLTYKVSICKWTDGKFYYGISESETSEGIDQWAEIPYPKKAKSPLDF